MKTTPAACLLLVSVFGATAQGAAATWTIARDPEQPRAVATAGRGATSMNSLAAVVGLDARQWSSWVTLPDVLRLADGTQATEKTLGPSDRVAEGQTVEVPNTVIAAWIGDFGEAGRQIVGWQDDIGYLRNRGFFVAVLDKPESSDHSCTGAGCPAIQAFGRLLVGALQVAGEARELHGFFATSHGNRECIGDTKNNIVHTSDLRKVYPLALLIVNACHADTWADLVAPGGKFHGPRNLMLPVLETGHPEELLAPGEQGTRLPPRRRPRRRVS